MEEAYRNFAIYTQNLTKKFGPPTPGLTAVDSVNLQIPKGKIYALIGPNGAGKTTLLKMLVGLYAPTWGRIFINGFDIVSNPIAAKEQFGYVSDNPTAYDFLTGREFLAFSGNLRGMKESELRKSIGELTSLFPITDILNAQMVSYSRGNRQKVAYLSSLISNPPILIIDEPVAGLDPKSIKILGETLRLFAKKGGAVLFVSHILSFGQKYADIVGLMNKGKIVTQENVNQQTSFEKIYEKAV